jgi:hypothetical protein
MNTPDLSIIDILLGRIRLTVEIVDIEHVHEHDQVKNQ